MVRENKQFQRTEDGHLIFMTAEERELLITDLAPRLKHGIICMIERYDDFGPIHRNEKLTGLGYEEGGYFYFDFCYGLIVDFAEKVKPYLRPMSSMTEEEKEEYINIKQGECNGCVLTGKGDPNTEFLLVDFFNAHHFDYRGLIEKGLAFKAPEGMYKIVSANT